MQTTIDRAGPADIGALVELMGEFYAESEYPLDRAWAEASFARLLADPGRGAAWIARRQSRLAGHIVLVLRHSMEFGGVVGVIDDLYVRSPFRRSGVGSALVAAAFEACKELHAAAVDVEVASGASAACAFYRAFGFAGHAGRETLTLRFGR